MSEGNPMSYQEFTKEDVRELADEIRRCGEEESELTVENPARLSMRLLRAGWRPVYQVDPATGNISER